MFISSCGIILIFFSQALYLVLQPYSIARTGVLIVPNIVDGSVSIRENLGGAGFSTLGVAGSHTIHAGDLCTIFGGAPEFLRWS